MRPILTALIALVFLFSLAGCDQFLPNEQTEAATQASATTGPQAEPTVPETTEPPTEPEPTQPLPYLITVSRADFPIYQGPTYHHPLAGYVQAAGVYTIVEEARDDSQNLWGRLKSGAGWVDLTRLAREESRGPLVSMSSLSELVASGDDYIYCPIAYDQYAQKIYLRANASLTNVEIFPLLFIEKMEEQAPVHTVSHWQAGEYLLLEASFPGDLSVYGIRVTDSDGVVYRYSIWENLSGEGAPFVLTSYAP